MMLQAELEFSGQLYLVLRRLKWWLLVAAAAGALGGAWLVQQRSYQASAEGHFSLTASRSSLLGAQYQQLANGSQLFIGALEVDELARFSLQFSDAATWQAAFGDAAFCQQHALCKGSADVASLARSWQARFSLDHKRRGNLLFLRLQAADSKEAALVLRQLISTVEQRDQTQQLGLLEVARQQLDQALAQATTVGERTLLATKLDQNLAEQNLWRQGYYAALKPVASLVEKAPARPRLAFAALLGALVASLATLTLALLLLRR